jgi:hypothetical protein
MLSAALDTLYPRCVTGANSHPGSPFGVSDPSPLDTFTIRPAGDRRRSGSIAWTTAAAPTRKGDVQEAVKRIRSDQRTLAADEREKRWETRSQHARRGPP